MMYRLRYETDH